MRLGKRSLHIIYFILLLLYKDDPAGREHPSDVASQPISLW